jgi:hypothetical protein
MLNYFTESKQCSPIIGVNKLQTVATPPAQDFLTTSSKISWPQQTTLKTYFDVLPERVPCSLLNKEAEGY